VKKTRPQPPSKTGTADRILDTAQRLVQTRGFNAFSYADISAKVGITKASLHYHFASKASLGAKLVERYDSDMMTALTGIATPGRYSREMLRDYVAIYRKVLADGRLCLCGMLAAEYSTLPKSMQKALDTYFQHNEVWLARVLSDGRARGELQFAGDAAEAAQYLVGALEGAMLIARSQGGQARFDAAARRLLAEFGI
jgi:TetR/AcrR family transcriptional regulator, transcriptional repressor for nem operon